MPRKSYVQVLDKETGVWKLVEKERAHHARVVDAPMFMEDIKQAVSPVDGTLISSRSKLREHNARNDVIDVGNDPSLRRPKPWVEPSGVLEDIQRAFQETGGY